MKKFCVLPFNSLSFSATGDLRVCCNSGKSFGFKLEQAENLESIINNKKVIEIRSDFLNGKESSFCERCWEIEKYAEDSFRKIANDTFSISEKNISNYSTEITFDDIEYLDITLGNKCNLACRMCNPYSSSLLAKQWISIDRHSKTSELIEFDRQTKDKILEIIKRSPNLSLIYMLGGEPLVSEFHDEIVDYLINTNRAKDITLHYSTNLHVDISKRLEAWSHFKKIDLNISIDGSNETYEYIRWPGKWSKITTNLNALREYCTRYDNIKPSISTTVQNLNVDNLYELITEVKKLSNNSLSFYFIPVTYFNLLELTPKNILINSLEKLSTLNDGTVYRLPELMKMIESAIQKSDNLDNKKVIEFFDWQRSYDKLRGQNLFLLKPHFKELAEKYGIDVW